MVFDELFGDPLFWSCPLNRRKIICTRLLNRRLLKGAAPFSALTVKSQCEASHVSNFFRTDDCIDQNQIEPLILKMTTFFQSIQSSVNLNFDYVVKAVDPSTVCASHSIASGLHIFRLNTAYAHIQKRTRIEKVPKRVQHLPKGADSTVGYQISFVTGTEIYGLCDFFYENRIQSQNNPI